MVIRPDDHRTRRRQAPPEAQFSGESDADLLVYMSMAKENPSAAQAAWEEFYHRHAGFLYAVCARAYSRMLASAVDLADLVAETFRRAYERAETFDSDGLSDPDRLRRRTRAWLGRIAHRIVLNLLREQSHLRQQTFSQEVWRGLAQEPRAREAEGRDLALLKMALGALSPKEQLVLRVAAQWHDAGAAHQRLPNKVCAELAAALQTTPENLRQIRRRALAKVQLIMQSNPVTAGEHSK